MDLDSRGYSKLINTHNTYRSSEEYIRIFELFSQSTLHLEKDKLASVSYDSDCHSFNYEAYKQVKITMTENTMLSASNFEPACISVISGQEMILPTFYQSSNYKSNISKIFISSQYAKQNNLLPFTKDTVLRLRDEIKVTIITYSIEVIII
ncbi:hypothetical protein GLOIN_2v1495193 [Rhizophagus clarus]|uniref:Uncharacterized protein n=1 Tax=Rhizophagus clarus TaxID=94130 RepID=A0A8H3LT98_9GLOM|nr:hypothetical protein GLOIN_2v1495193 [Rhizophagus clarus]